MISEYFTELLGGRQAVTILTACPVDEAVRRLSEGVSTSRFAASFGGKTYGHVSREAVYLERVSPFFANSFRPVFEGRFEERLGIAVLIGSFGLARSIRRSIAFFVGFGLFWSVMAGCSVLIDERNHDLPIWFPFAGIGMSIFAVALARIGADISSGDIDWLSREIRKRLCC